MDWHKHIPSKTAVFITLFWSLSCAFILFFPDPMHIIKDEGWIWRIGATIVASAVMFLFLEKYWFFKIVMGALVAVVSLFVAACLILLFHSFHWPFFCWVVLIYLFALSRINGRYVAGTPTARQPNNQ